MDSDLLLVGGMILAISSVVALISAFSSDRPIRAAVALATVGATMMLIAYASKPEGYRPDEIPTVVLRVVADIFR